MSERSHKITATHVLSMTKMLYKKYFVPILIVNLLFASMSLTNSILNSQYHAPMLGRIISIVLSAIINSVFLWYLYKKERGEHISFEKAFSRAAPRFISVVITNIIVNLLVALGFLLFIIPGIIWWTMFSMAMPYVLLQNKGIKAALDASKVLTKGHRRAIFNTFALFYLPLFLLGFIILFIANTSAVVQTYSFFVTVLFGAVPLLIVYSLWTLLHKTHNTA